MKNRPAKHKPLKTRLEQVNGNKGIYIAENSREVDTVVRRDKNTLVIKHKI